MVLTRDCICAEVARCLVDEWPGKVSNDDGDGGDYGDKDGGDGDVDRDCGNDGARMMMVVMMVTRLVTMVMVTRMVTMVMVTRMMVVVMVMVVVEMMWQGWG